VRAFYSLGTILSFWPCLEYLLFSFPCFQRLLYWTDWGDPAKIERASMDGSERRVLISGNHIEWPVDLAIDYTTRKLYWIDAKLKVIKHCDMDGSNVREVVNQGIVEPSGITVFEDHMYWIDKKTIKKANKLTGKNVTVLVNEAFSPLDLHIYHPQRQPTGTQNRRTFFKLSRV